MPRIHNIRTGRRKMTDEERWQTFLDKIGPPDAGGHRPWRGAHDDAGYGHFWDGQRLVVAHRYLYEHEHGPLPPWPKQIVRHTCDRTWCMTEEHLVAGTHLDNWRDSRERGRDRWAAYNGPTCRRGHLRTPENTTTQGACRPCTNQQQRERRRRQRGQARKQRTPAGAGASGRAGQTELDSRDCS